MNTSRVVYLFAAVSAGLLFSQTSPAQLARSAEKEAYRNYDIRDPEIAAAAAKTISSIRGRTGAAKSDAVARTIESMRAAQAALAARIPGLQWEPSRFWAAPEAIGTDSARNFLTPESARPNADTARQFLVEQAALFGLTSEQANALEELTDYRNPASNMAWVEFRQVANGIPVFQGEIRAAFTANGALARTTGNLAPGLDYAHLPTQPLLNPAAAAAQAAATIGVDLNAAKLQPTMRAESRLVSVLGNGPFVRPIRTELIYFPIEPGVATLAYSMVLWTKGDAYSVIVDAADGTLLWRKDITDYQTQAVTYGVYTDDSPAPLSPSTVLPGQGTQAPGIGRTLVTLIGNEPPNTFNNLGWMTDGVNTTTGNNVDCGLDISSPDGIDTNGRAIGSPNRVFNFAYQPAPNGSDAPTAVDYRNGAVTNLFYWTNVYHDRLYLLGFTEAARNFQTNNFSRGGTGNDAVSAQVQDSSGTNNANFSTPSDGSPGVMQMYVFTGPTPDRDGSLDADVFLHEMTHGTSNRLHANGSGLATQQAGGMGEGWSDFYARCLLSSADEDVYGNYPMGGYVTLMLGGAAFSDNYYYGIRRFPYATKQSLGPNGKPYNPLTFGTIDFAQINALSNGAYPPSPVIGITANEVHNIGHFWCTTLLEVRARMIARLGWSVGNQRALQIVTDAMKLDVSSPTILQARDSIIAADNAGFAGADVNDIRSGFATRGVGAGSSSTGSTTFTIVESFYPSSVAGTITVLDSLGKTPAAVQAGQDLTITIPLTNRLTTTDNNVTGKIGNDKEGYGNIAAAATLSRSFAYHVPETAGCGSVVQVPLVISSDNGVANVSIPIQLGTPSTTVSFSENFDGVTQPALPTGWTITTTGSTTANWKTANTTVIDVGNYALGPDISTAADAALVSPVIALGLGSQQMSFKHRFTFETPYDGGVLEIKIGAGSFTDIVTAGGSFVQGGYGASITSSATGNVLIGRRVWSGTIPTTNTVIVNLPPAASGQSVQFRWRVGSDSSTSSTGWFVDTVQIYSTSYSCGSQ